MGKNKISDNLNNLNEEISQYTEKVLDEFLLYLDKKGELKYDVDNPLIYKFMKKKGY